MNIQLSVLVWTVICFVALMLILRNLLFKPVLKVMDDRNERIKKAKEKKTEHEKMTSEYNALCEQKQKEYSEEQQKAVLEEIESIRTESKRAMDSAKESRIAKLDEFRIQTDKKHHEIMQILTVHAQDIAISFAESIVKE